MHTETTEDMLQEPGTPQATEMERSGKKVRTEFGETVSRIWKPLNGQMSKTGKQLYVMDKSLVIESNYGNLLASRKALMKTAPKSAEAKRATALIKAYRSGEAWRTDGKSRKIIQMTGGMSPEAMAEMRTARDALGESGGVMTNAGAIATKFDEFQAAHPDWDARFHLSMANAGRGKVWGVYNRAGGNGKEGGPNQSRPFYFRGFSLAGGPTYSAFTTGNAELAGIPYKEPTKGRSAAQTRMATKAIVSFFAPNAEPHNRKVLFRIGGYSKVPTGGGGGGASLDNY